MDGNTALLLAQVQRIEPQAFIRAGEGFIQAGSFSTEENARQRVRELEEYGLSARMVKIEAKTTPQIEPKENEVEPKEREAKKSGYFVVIPSSIVDLPAIVAIARDSGIERQKINENHFSLGRHVAVGPFDSRADADRWTGYFRSYGMDARVYFDS